MTDVLVAIFLAVLNSLWQAALAAGLVGMALKALPKFRIAVNAATRYAIWWVVLALVLALPLAPGLRNELRLLWTPRVSSPAAAADQVRAHRVTVPVEAPAPVMLPQPKSAKWPWWIFGVAAVVLVYRMDQIGRSYFYLRGLKRRAASSPQALPATTRPVRLLLSREVASPMAVGFLHPAVVLPDSLIHELSPAELEHVLLHEVAHIARRDDWTNLAARVLGAALALHPVAWWILRQMEREREIACDDWVVARTGSDPSHARAYAESLARLSELRWARKAAVSGEALASGIFGGGSRAVERIELLLSRGREFSGRASMARVAMSAAAMLGFVLAGSTAPRWIAFAQDAQKTPRLSFEAATVKPNSSGDLRSARAEFLPGGGYAATNVPLRVLITGAYQLPVAGGPGWIESEMFDIRAAASSSMAAGLSEKERIDRTRAMLQTLLADRFKLAIHRGTKEFPVYALEVAKGGPKLVKAKLAEKDCPDASTPPAPNSVFCHGLYGGQGLGIYGQTVNMADLTGFLTGVLDKQVVDQTGVQGLFDLNTEGWTPLQPGEVSQDAPAANDADRRSVFSVLQEQLGLRLEAAKAPLEVVVIDHVERPDAN